MPSRIVIQSWSVDGGDGMSASVESDGDGDVCDDCENDQCQ